MNPMLKYRSGKSKEIVHFINNMPKEYMRYIIPEYAVLFIKKYITESRYCVFIL